MDEISVFQDKSKKSTNEDLADKLGETNRLWLQIENFVMQKYLKGMADWNFPWKKYGWSYRIKKEP